MNKNSILSVRLFLLILLAAITVNSCGPSEAARREEIETAMKSWVGKSETDLVARWGAPNRTYKTMDGSRELTYRYTQSSSSPGYVWYDSWGRTHISRPTKHSKTVERSFTINTTGTIIAYHWSGL